MRNIGKLPVSLGLAMALLLFCAPVFARSALVLEPTLDGPMLASFEKERDRLDAMMSGHGGSAAHISDAAGGPLQVSNR